LEVKTFMSECTVQNLQRIGMPISNLMFVTETLTLSISIYRIPAMYSS